MSDVTIVKEGWVQKRGKLYLLMESASDVFLHCVQWYYVVTQMNVDLSSGQGQANLNICSG